jgi:hypothetical protein|tara:strand:- start:1493 stop:1810 length:318 start_codon:yes stop_codon:yes gene_type:complete
MGDVVMLDKPGIPVSLAKLPEHMRDGMRLYLEAGIEPGGFAMGVLTNDFKAAVGRADSINSHRLHDWMLWVHNDIPMLSQGSPEIVSAWMTRQRKKDRWVFNFTE